jgi:hypothetical protein
MRKFAIPLILAAVSLVATTASAGPEKAPFTLVFEGARTASPATEKFTFGFPYEGAFTALAPMCETGHAVDLEQLLTDGLMTGLRRFECDGGAGSIVARTWRLGGDRSWGYEEGAWQIVAGTGAYEGLRGKGRYVRAFPEGAPASIAEVWRGLVDFEDLPPQVTVLRTSIVAPRRPGRGYVVRVAFSTRDASGGPVSFLVTARSSILLGARYGVASPGASVVVLNVHPRDGERAVRLEISATDQFGNERTVARTRRLPQTP